MQEFTGSAKTYQLIYASRPYKEEAEFVYEWAEKPTTILELGIGQGNHARYLCNKAKITGLEGSQEMLKYAYKHENISYRCGKIDEITLRTLSKTECVMALFNVVGYVPLYNILPYLRLDKDKYFIFDCWDKEKSQKDLPFLRAKFFGNECYRISIPIKREGNTLEIDYIIVDKGNTVFEKHFVRNYSQEEIEIICARYGYSIADTKPTENWTMWYKLRRL